MQRRHRLFEHTRTIHILLVAMLSSASLGCFRSITPGGPAERPDCAWRSAVRIDTAPPFAADTLLVAAVAHDDTALLFVSVETVEGEFGYIQYRVDPQMKVLEASFTKELFPRAVRIEENGLSMVAYDTVSRAFVYREVDASGVETRRADLMEALSYETLASQLAIDSTHVLMTRERGAPYPLFSRTWRRADLSRALLDGTSGRLTARVDTGFEMSLPSGTA
jgi:hypothetical protein